ncbi:hypothetical protein [Paraburkholderia sp. MM5482-R1]|uniref:hypothetical protein n=1 Tax=unclassified Paraburkholderia TaxID=2615204 RepID=UPI003D225189
MPKPLDDLIADSMTDYLRRTGSSDTVKVEAPATWHLCTILTDHGLATSESTGVATRQIGPFRLAVTEDSPRDISTLITAIIPIALSGVVTNHVEPISIYTAALTFAFKVLASTFSSGCLIEDLLEWKLLLRIKHDNSRTPPVYPTPDVLVDALNSARLERPALLRSQIYAAMEQLKAKKPLWGSKNVSLVQQHENGGFEALA